MTEVESKLEDIKSYLNRSAKSSRGEGSMFRRVLDQCLSAYSASKALEKNALILRVKRHHIPQEYLLKTMLEGLYLHMGLSSYRPGPRQNCLRNSQEGVHAYHQTLNI